MMDADAAAPVGMAVDRSAPDADGWTVVAPRRRGNN
jgi:hypothetical protein